MGGNGCVNTIMEIFSQYKHISKHHSVHFKYITFFCQLYLNKQTNKKRFLRPKYCMRVTHFHMYLTVFNMFTILFYFLTKQGMLAIFSSCQNNACPLQKMQVIWINIKEGKKSSKILPPRDVIFCTFPICITREESYSAYSSF